MTESATAIRKQLTEWFLRRTPPSGIRRVQLLSAAIASETGAVRSENQDRVGIARGFDGRGVPFAIAAVADGIGGMKDGGKCASVALAALFTTIHEYAQGTDAPELWLAKGIAEANRLIHAKYQLSGGTTLVALLLTADGSYWSNVGDSRLYSSAKSELVQISKDDTIAGQLGRRPDIGTEQSKLLQFIGIGEPLEVKVQPVRVGPEEMAILTTDGVHFLERPGGVLGLVIQHAADPGTCVRRLVELANWAGGPDNASALVIPFHISAGLEDNVGSEVRPLEVWDPYGELRIIDIRPSMAAAIRLETVPARPDAEQTPPKPEQGPRALTGKGSEPIPAAKKVMAKKEKAKRKSRKSGTKVPQVQLEFSPKGD